MEEKLKPCPFGCGKEYLTIYDYQNYYNLPYHWKVRCGKCGGEGPLAKSRQEAIDAWNKRS